MEKNSLNKSYIYIIAIFAIGIAISNIISFFNGVGFALIGASLLLVLAIANILKDDENKKRFGDIFALIMLEFLMLIVLFFAYDFNLDGITSKFPMVMRNICAIYSMLATAYVVFRYISEINGKRYKFIEYMLGNYVPDPTAKKKNKEKVKKNKELENGTLAPKPSSIQSNEEKNDVAQDDLVKDAESELNEENIEVVKDSEVNSEEKKEEHTENVTASNSTINNRTNFWY